MTHQILILLIALVLAACGAEPAPGSCQAPDGLYTVVWTELEGSCGAVNDQEWLLVQGLMAEQGDCYVDPVWDPKECSSTATVSCMFEGIYVEQQFSFAEGEGVAAAQTYTEDFYCAGLYRIRLTKKEKAI